MDDGRPLAGIAAHARIIYCGRRALAGMDARLHIPVRGVHEAECIGVEMSLWLLGHRELHDCCRAFERCARVLLRPASMTVHYDRRSLEDGYLGVHQDVLEALMR